MISKTISERISVGQAKVGIIGLGYVGLPLAREFVRGGLNVIGFDVDPEKVVMLNAGKSYIEHIGTDEVGGMVQSGRFSATTDMGRLGEPDAILICVPTPLTRQREPDMTYIERSTEMIAKVLRRGQLIILESTTYPGTTRDVVLPILEQKGLKLDQDFLLAFSPEREDPGRKSHNTHTIPKLVGGMTPASTEAAVALYQRAVQTVIPVRSAEVAEAAKILENTYRAVNIALVNELKMVFDAMGIDVWEVIEAAATKPFGFSRFNPGPGLGGHCIPIDPFYLTWKARQFEVFTWFIELAGEVNRQMPDYVIKKVILALNQAKKSLNGARILVLGLAYKKDVDDVRESPSVILIEKLEALGAQVDYNDPHIPGTHKQREHDLQKSSVPIDPSRLAGYDLVLLATDHSSYDYELIAKHARLIVDTRNAFGKVQAGREKIVKA